MISKFRPKNTMISDFGEKKLPNSGMTHFNHSELDGKKVIPLCIYSKPSLITNFGG